MVRDKKHIPYSSTPASVKAALAGDPGCARDDNSDANVTTSVNLNQRRQALSVHHKSATGGDNADCRQHQSEVPVAAVVREQGNGGDHQSDLEKHLAKVVAIRAPAGQPDFRLQAARFVLDVLLLVAILVNLIVEAFLHLVGAFGLWWYFSTARTR